MRLFLFDIDQTLISTGGAGIRALNRAFRKVLSMERAMDGIAPHGKTDPGIVREVLLTRLGEDGAMQESLGVVLEAYLFFLREEVHLSENYRVLPGIVEILLELTARENALVGLATGNVELGARIKLERGGLNRYFAFGGFGSDSENRVDLVRRAAERACQAHPGIDARNTFVIGDTPRDVAAGLAAGFRTVGVATGRFTVDELRECGACLAISNFEAGRDDFLRLAEA